MRNIFLQAASNSTIWSARRPMNSWCVNSTWLLNWCWKKWTCRPLHWVRNVRSSSNNCERWLRCLPGWWKRELLAHDGESEDRALLFLANQFLAQHGGVAGKREAGFEIDDAVADELGDFSVEVLHAFGGAGFHGVQQGLAF